MRKRLVTQSGESVRELARLLDTLEDREVKKYKTGEDEEEEERYMESGEVCRCAEQRMLQLFFSMVHILGKNGNEKKKKKIGEEYNGSKWCFC